MYKKVPPIFLAAAVTILLPILFFSLAGKGSGQSSDLQTPPEAPLAPVGNAFSYQGHLTSGGAPANGAYDFEFKLFDAAAAGAQVGATVPHGDIPVANGIFTVELNFGTSAFGAGARWLEIGVRPGSSVAAYTTLSPRQKLTPAPYALAMPNVYTDEAANFVGVGRNFRISGNEVFGVRFNGSPNQYGGMYVETSNAQGWPFYGYATNGSFYAWTYYNGANKDWYLYNAGIRLRVPDTGGLVIGPSLDYSLVISNTPGSDGIRVLDTGDDAIQIGSSPDIPNYGVYIPSPGVSTYGIWSNTSNALGEWAFYSVDNIQAGNVLANGHSLVAKVTGAEALQAGDVVAVTGVADPIPGATDRLPQVQRADAALYNGVIGVVKSRMVYEVAPGKEEEGEMSMHSADGPAQPGDYVQLVVMGVTQVKVDSSVPIVAGDRLTASSLPGLARPLLKQEINGMLVAEGAPVFAIALETPVKGQDVIYVFVTLR